MIFNRKNSFFTKTRVRALIVLTCLFPLGSLFRLYGNSFSLIPNPMALAETEAESQKALILALTLMVVAMSVFACILWQKNLVLIRESVQIKSKLNQQLYQEPDKSLQSAHEEHKQQVLMLNERQQKIVDLMAFGFSNKQIADKLFISENTVKYHIKNIYHVLHVKDRKELWISQS